ncbi:MAG TPA: hypothetical protein VKU02_12390 [Gemmataceae bacterium]|nr:hypothetical protein [Gemmataceae bacterium]
MFRSGRVQVMFALAVAVVALGTVAVPQAAAQPSGVWLPLQLFGYNADVITDADQNVRFAQLFDSGCCGWFETGAIDDNGTEHDDGIPAGSTFPSLTGSGVNYLIQPAVYNNVLQISNNAGAQAQGVPASGTLTLVTPAPYSQIAVFASSGNSNGTAQGQLVINYADGTSTDPINFDAHDWCGGTSPASVIPVAPFSESGGIGRVGNGLTATGSSKFSYQFTCGPQGFEAYETIIATDNTKNIVSVTFTPPDSGTNRANVFGISAIP